MQDKAAFDPENRALYTALFRAPDGYVFDRAAATTYSLDFETALAVLMAIAAEDTVERAKALAQPLSLLRAVQRMSKRVTIYCDRGRILHAPAQIAPLMALCESMIVEVAAPGGGAFHPKLWCVRFTAIEEGGGPDHLRLAILSRNLSPDRSWDLSLVLDGEVGRGVEAGNAPLVALMKQLSKITSDGGAGVDRSLVQSLSRCRWELPMGAQRVSFAVNGIRGAGKGFIVPKGNRLAIVSPFVSTRGLAALRSGVGKSATCSLVARAVELDLLPAGVLKPFDGRVHVLDDALIDPPLDEPDSASQDGTSLHAKAMLVETGNRISVSVGSANATAAALVPMTEGITRNIEVMATLSGTIRRMGGIDDILFCDPFVALLTEYTTPIETPVEDDWEAVEKLLEEARGCVAALRLDLHCRKEEEGNVSTNLQLARGQEAAALPEGLHCSIRMLASRNVAGVDAASLLEGLTLPLGTIALSDLTRWIGVRLRHVATGTECSFTLGTTLIDPPRGRDTAALRAIIDTKDFLKYIALLLGEGDEGGAWEPGLEGVDGTGTRMIFEENDAILEPLVRALCRNNGELAEIARLLDALRDPETGASAAPEDFMELWRAFAPLSGKSTK